MADTKFEGWVAYDKETGVGGMKWEAFQPKDFEETDVDVKISHCGVCGTDVHSLRSGLFPSNYPCVAGHEIVGEVTKAGSKVSNVKVGQTVGIGSQIGSCGQCPSCTAGHENYCHAMIMTYNAQYPNGQKTYGGFASNWRGPASWVFTIPEGIKPAEAAPLLCGGITVYAPLKRFGAGKGKNVGIVGLGGLGHFGVLFAKALGADKVYAFSRSSKKKEDATKLGATDFVATGEEEGWGMKNAGQLDIIINTLSTSELPLQDYLMTLRPHGTFVQVGSPFLPDINAVLPLMIFKGISIAGSLIGSPGLIKEMLELVVEKGIHPVVQEKSMKEANEVVKALDGGEARYRYVLVQ